MTFAQSHKGSPPFFADILVCCSRPCRVGLTDKSPLTIGPWRPPQGRSGPGRTPSPPDPSPGPTCSSLSCNQNPGARISHRVSCIGQVVISFCIRGIAVWRGARETRNPDPANHPALPAIQPDAVRFAEMALSGHSWLPRTDRAPRTL
jgi:hypothetical protein